MASKRRRMPCLGRQIGRVREPLSLTTGVILDQKGGLHFKHMGCSQNSGPFWLLIILRHQICRGTKMGPQFWELPTCKRMDWKPCRKSPALAMRRRRAAELVFQVMGRDALDIRSQAPCAQSTLGLSTWDSSNTGGLIDECLTHGS